MVEAFIIAVVMVGGIVWINVAHRRMLGRMAPAERAELDAYTKRETQTW